MMGADGYIFFLTAPVKNVHILNTFEF